SDDVNTQYLVVILGRNQFDEAGGRFHGPGTAAGSEWELADLVGTAAGLHLLFCQAHPGDFRVGVDHGRNGVVVHVAVFAGNQVADHHALVLGLVRQHESAHAVTHRPDVFGRRLAVVVHLDETLLVDLHAGSVAEQVAGERPAAHADDELVDVEDVRARGIGVIHLDAAGGGLRA